MPDLSTITRLKFGEVWEHEARHFTPWLAENIHVLDEVLNMELELIQREAPVGPFSADIHARDLTYDRAVVIESQRGVTDHQHLGKLITYAADLEAKAVVWISSEMQEEHRQAIDWLNRNAAGDVEFYGVILELLKIDDSRPAYNFRLIAFPNNWQRRNRTNRKRMGEKGLAYQKYFQGLMDELRERHHLTRARTALPQNWCRFPSGVPGVALAASFTDDGRVSAELYVSTGDAAKNKGIFDELFRLRTQIGKAFGESLDWQRMDESDACRVAVYRAGTIQENEGDLEEIRKWTIVQLLKIKSVFTPRVENTLVVKKGKL